VHCEDLLIDNGGDRQAIEAVGKGLPQPDVISPLAFVVEAVDTVDASTLMVPTKKKEVLGVLNLIGEEEADSLEGLLTAVDIIAKEEVVGFWGKAAVLEQAEEVVVLAMDVAADLEVGQSWMVTSQTEQCIHSDRRFQLEEHGL